jgi:3-methylfumaryl-CoA hydratase
MSEQNWNEWIGRSQVTTDVASHSPVQRLAATLNRDWDVFSPANASSLVLPPLSHWLYFLPSELQIQLGADGHAKKGASGGIMPPIDLPRRMWAGSQLQFHREIPLGGTIERTSRIASIVSKTGKTGQLVFVKVTHEIRCAGELAITDCHDIVYREAISNKASSDFSSNLAMASAPSNEQFARQIVPDATLLFRYSALTFNGHRIHYDYPYVTEVEGYPGLIVHGPLIATLLLDELRIRHPNARIASYEFKAISPLFHHQSFEVCGRVDANTATLWARNHAGDLAMQASAVLD